MHIPITDVFEYTIKNIRKFKSCKQLFITSRIKYFGQPDIYKCMKDYTDDLPQTLNSCFSPCSFLFEKKDGFKFEEFTELDFISSINENLPYIPYRFVRSTLTRINVPTAERKTTC